MSPKQPPSLIPPHGGRLIDRLVHEREAAADLAEAERLPKVKLIRRELADLWLIGEGALSPLTGFSGRTEVESILATGRLLSGVAWTIPITLGAKGLAAEPKDNVALVDEGGVVRATLEVSERFDLDPDHLCQQVFGTKDPKHPGVAAVLAEDRTRLAGEIRVFPFVSEHPRRLSPTKTREELASRGWTDVAAFQTRNPLHRSHEYLLRVALEVSDGLMLQPLVGETKAGDIPADVRMACYEVLVRHYLPEKRVLLTVLDAAMRYAGPAEAIHHAIMRQNFGASKFIVGRDHAGVGSYYGPFDAQARFDHYDPKELAIRPLKLDISFWCGRCGGVATPRTCAHDQSERLELSGTEVRRRLAAGESLPEAFTRPEIAEILRRYYAEER